MLNVNVLTSIEPLKDSALITLNKLIFNPKKAYGSCDGETYFDFGHNISKEVNKIQNAINNRSYEFDKMELKKVRRQDNKIRNIYLSSWKDRIIEGWLNSSMTTALRNWFSKSSYAYRDGHVPIDKCQAVIGKYCKKHKFFVKRDISNYFESINKSILLEQLEKVVDRNIWPAETTYKF